MSGAATAARSAVRRRWAPIATGAALLTLLLGIGNAAGPYLFRVATLESEIATQVRLTTGLVVTSGGPARFDLLPSPRVSMTAIHVSDPSGSVTIESETLRGEVRLLPLLVGRVELASATLVKPTLVIDLDGKPMPRDSVIGRAMLPLDASPRQPTRRLGAVTLLGGKALLLSKTRHLPELTGIDATVDWRDLDSPATVNGAIRAAGTEMSVAAWIERPSALLRGASSAAALRLHSDPLDLSATGEVSGAAAAGFKGHVAASAPTLAALLALCGHPAVLPAPFRDFVLNSDAAVSVDPRGATTLDLTSLHLVADGNAYEGTLAVRDAGPALLSGTLAIDDLALAPFLSRAPAPFAPDRSWSTARIAHVDRLDALRLDLRISAARMRLPSLTMEDAALSVMTRGDRIEIALNEGGGYGGAVKGRLSIGSAGEGFSLRGAGALTGADAAALGWDLFGRQVAAGTLSASAAFETEGSDAAAMVAHASGWMKTSTVDGDLNGADLGAALRAVAAARPAEAAAAMRSGRTPFQTLGVDLRLADGVATVGSAVLQGRDARLDLGGTIDLLGRSLDLHGLARGAEATPVAGDRLPLSITGSLAAPRIRPDVERERPAADP